VRRIPVPASTMVAACPRPSSSPVGARKGTGEFDPWVTHGGNSIKHISSRTLPVCLLADVDATTVCEYTRSRADTAQTLLAQDSENEYPLMGRVHRFGPPDDG
jgi:hypothetical protein